MLFLIWATVLLLAVVVTLFFRWPRAWTLPTDGDGSTILYYINLDRRPDRDAQVRREIAKLGLPPDRVVRVSAVDRPRFGALGCSLSHIECLERFMRLPPSFTRCIVLEDDFEFVDPSPGDRLRRLFQGGPTFDVCMLSMSPVEIDLRTEESLAGCARVRCAQTASGYLVGRHFVGTLLANFREGAALLEATHYNHYDQYAIDQYWKSLQPGSAWYGFWPALGRQRASFSDIHQTHVDYGV